MVYVLMYYLKSGYIAQYYRSAITMCNSKVLDVIRLSLAYRPFKLLNTKPCNSTVTYLITSFHI